ncbi:MAG: hypothetical protein MI749_17945 [Desulfovibrionales bacterium]|nr:hypothetical protein [Desulfovibrionales bacterium]
MAGQVSKLPGIHCAYYIQGRCFYEEHINPGDHEEWQCTEIRRILHEYDDFVERADRFSLDDEEAGKLWEVHEESLPLVGTLCPSYCPNPCKQCGKEGQITDCEHEQALICILQLPVCTGVCRRYKHSITAEAAQGCQDE